jgi:phage shock protein A
MEEKIEDRAAQGSAMAEVEEALGTGKRDDLEAKFRDLEHSIDKGKSAGGSGDPDMDAEIAALKKRVRV